ncbi:MAG: hypothetical protein ACYDDO_13495 [Acidiferrobacterales bacterium]
MISPDSEDGSASVDIPTTVNAYHEPAAARENPTSRTAAAVAVLAVIALVAALYLARAFFVPLLIGILASYMLRPLVEGLTVC